MIQVIKTSCSSVSEVTLQENLVSKFIVPTFL